MHRYTLIAFPRVENRDNGYAGPERIERMDTLNRRALLVSAGGIGLLSLSGCLSADNTTESADESSLIVTITNEQDQEVAVELVMATAGTSFDDGTVIGNVTFGVRGDEYLLGPMRGHGNGPFRFGLRHDGGEWRELQHRWYLDECIEFELHLRIKAAEEIGLSVQCRPPPP